MNYVNPAPAWPYVITLDEFKLFFLRESGVEYQGAPTWLRTTWNVGEVCFENNTFYSSLIDMNYIAPSAETEEPVWEPLTFEYEEGVEYAPGTIVFYNGIFWEATENSVETPSTTTFWNKVNTCARWPKARVWEAPKAYNAGDKALAIVNFKPSVMVSQMDENYTDPSVSIEVEDIPGLNYWEPSEEDNMELEDWVLDLDISRAMGEASFKFNPTLFSEQKGKMIFLYLTMFFLVYDRQMAAGGLNGNSAAGPVVHRTVGKMSVSYAESKLFQSYPSYEFLATNDYGRKAFNLMLPYLRGGVRVLRGGSTGE